MEKVRFGIVGLGSMGTSHADRVWKGDIPGLELAAVCDINPARLDHAKTAYPGVATFDKAEDLYESGLCDLVIVATPHYDHPKLVISALEHDLHVISEKPAGVYTKQVLEMNEAAKKSNKLFAIMFNQRTNPMYQKLREMIQRGDLGKIKRINWIITTWYRSQAYHDSATWRSNWKLEGGGTLINQNPHQLDLWQWMFGMPSKIRSFVSFGKYYDIEVEDDVTAFMEYENGATGVYITSTGEAPGVNRLEVTGDMGVVIIENGKMTFKRNYISEREFNKTNESPFGLPECWTCEIPVKPGSGEQHNGVLKNVTNAILKGEKLLSPGLEGINGLTISNAMHYSTWIDDWADVKNFPHDDFYAKLQEKIATSKPKKAVEAKAQNLEGTY
ncbi:MAG: Gfo/Idh/MocA family oxidoreductase [Clostridia bacterium]|nr:Gfo/Idh/MocA family oxidoreductase [Clostridia bacterium]